MRRYYVSLVVLTLVMVLAAFCIMWFMSEKYLPILPFMALYFGLVTGTQHFIVVKSLYRAPKTFIQVFLASVIGVLFLHMAFLALYVFNNIATAHTFLIVFCVGYVATLVFETVALILLIKSERKKRDNN